MGNFRARETNHEGTPVGETRAYLQDWPSSGESTNLMSLVQGLQPALDAFVDLFGAANIGMRIVGLK